MRDTRSQNQRDSTSPAAAAAAGGGGGAGASTTAAAARIRNNQRRCRERHREFVQELKAKLNDYERRGIQATLEMRQAARTVALENTRLRSLLASRGVSREDVELYLASFGSQTSEDQLAVVSTAAQIMQAGERPAASGSEPPHSHLFGSKEHEKLSSDFTVADMMSMFQDGTDTMLGEEESEELSFLSPPSAHESCCGSTTQCSAGDEGQQQDNNIQTDMTSMPSTDLAATAGRETGLAIHDPMMDRTSCSASSLEMPCAVAAHIVANARQFGNEEMAREDLGCLGPGECFISNIALFQLLDL